MSGRPALRILGELDRARREALPDAPVDFLRELGGPSLLRVPGRDRSRVRAVSTLLHGNEPSGLRALLAWLRSDATPAVDALVFVGAVDAALAEPGFANRMLPDARDLNRCFLGDETGAEAGPEVETARALLEQLRAAAPEALIDIHNNTGHNPPYGVGPLAGVPELNLVGLFANRYVHSDLRLGAIVEATQDDFPSVTIECGRAGDPAADATALAGLERYLEREELETVKLEPQSMELLHDPIQVCIAAGLELAFAEHPEADADLTVARDVDRHNFEVLAPGTRIGWLGSRGIWPVVARNARNEEVSQNWFLARDGALEVRRRLVPIMMTTDPAIARSDCLFYIVGWGPRAEGSEAS